MKVQAQIQIQAARSAVWQRFAAIETWHVWNSEVLSAQWVHGEPWQEGSVFTITHRTLFGATRATRYIVRMCVTERTAVYESASHFPLGMTSAVQFTDSLGGCRLDASHHYNGPLSPLVGLLKGRQQRLLSDAMRALKHHVEGPRR